MVGFEGEIVNEAIFFGDNFYNATCVSLGNPNCVLMLEEVSQKKAMQLGPYVENSRYFPNRINMQLCQVLDRENIQIEIYERRRGLYIRVREQEPVQRLPHRTRWDLSATV